MAKYGPSRWRELLQDALSESDIGKLPEKIAMAEVAVCRRLESLKRKSQASSEQQVLEDALNSLSALKNRCFPGWNKRPT